MRGNVRPQLRLGMDDIAVERGDDSGRNALLSRQVSIFMRHSRPAFSGRIIDLGAKAGEHRARVPLGRGILPRVEINLLPTDGASGHGRDTDCGRRHGLLVHVLACLHRRGYCRRARAIGESLVRRCWLRRWSGCAPCQREGDDDSEEDWLHADDTSGLRSALRPLFRGYVGTHVGTKRKAPPTTRPDSAGIPRDHAVLIDSCWCPWRDSNPQPFP
jgi:hypothetical protein